MSVPPEGYLIPQIQNQSIWHFYGRSSEGLWEDVNIVPPQRKFSMYYLTISFFFCPFPIVPGPISAETSLLTFLVYIHQTLLSKATYSAFRLYIFWSVHVFPGNRTHYLCAANAMLDHWATGTLVPMVIPSSNGNSCILIIVDHFSKSCWLIPLKCLSTAMEMTELLFNYVFHYFDLLEDIIFDCGPQLISQVWKSFFKLNVTVSLSSTTHNRIARQNRRSKKSATISETSAITTRTPGASS